MSRIISPRNLYSKISEFLFLFNHMHEFLPFYLFIYFSWGLQIGSPPSELYFSRFVTRAIRPLLLRVSDLG